MIKVSDIIARLSNLLLDEERGSLARWSDEELIQWINDSRMAILSRKPSACAKVDVVTLTQGSLQQSPTDMYLLLDISRNMGQNKATPGRSIRRTDRQNIDDLDPYWHMASGDEITQFTYDERVPKVFYVYPPATTSMSVEILYSFIPPEVSTADDYLQMNLENMDPIINYVAYRAKSKDSEYSNAGEAAAYYTAFNDSLGVMNQTQSTSSPNQPGNSV